MDTKDFYYDLPEELIAQTPVADRSSSRLLHLDRASGAVSHHIFKDVKQFLRPGDCLVLNNTRVIPARLYGTKADTGAAVEVLLLKRVKEDEVTMASQESDRRSSLVWECLVKPGKKMRVGAKVTFGDGLMTGEVIGMGEEGNRLIRFEFDGIFEEMLDRLGEMPLPPYIKEKLQDRDRYQTVYAKFDGSAAAPTAGLHFTPELLNEIRDMGVDIAEVTLHVGLGTFRPVKVADISEHHMHSEYFEISRDACDRINHARSEGGRIICVGTTSVRTLESAAKLLNIMPSTNMGAVTDREDAKADISVNNELSPVSGWTDIFIYPGYRFKLVDGLITNFHLPESTLIMLVSAFAGRENVLNAYKTAVEERYRFFSFGDAMILI
ncbi:MAG: tRNA preQ1(34) S-adenosylmethionine ribosyltransferase-isomerase QueA [Lachnospiraceae bacterium]|nr:tRNA preQ1(34) S-adenosylmethionine ribosyltransferase-isomerase QueA [Lachnospiraceae bacterium]